MQINETTRLKENDELAAAIRSLDEQIVAAREAELRETPERDQVSH